MAKNPFKPTFGKTPSTVAGRQGILESMCRAFEDGPGNPNLSSLVVGPRGSGKTVLLSLIAEEARHNGWVAARVSALPGMLEDVIERTREAARGLDVGVKRGRAAGVEAPRISEPESAPAQDQVERGSQRAGNWRTRMNGLLDELAEHDVGLLLTVDEVRADVDEMVQLASAYQHFVQEDRKVALAMAGLPFHVNSLLGKESVAFLRRARRLDLGAIGGPEIENALRDTVAGAGGSISDKALAACTEAAEGSPYMLQLVGFWAWESSKAGRIGSKAARRGIRQAREEMRVGMLDATYRELSPGDLRFLEAMLGDDGESRLADISARMGVKSNYATKYKSRLLERGVIADRGHGYLAFDLPGFRDYLATR